jgi:serine protease Do
MKNSYAALVVLILTLALLLLGCSPQNTEAPPTATVTTSVTTTTAVTTTATIGLGSSAISDIEATLESIYNQTNPSVVYIEVSFADGGASGSGFVWDTEGDIVTNNHVVDGADSITVTFYNDVVAPATLVGQDIDSDLAVIKVDVDAGQLKPVTMGDSTALKVGQMAIAIGNPYGYQGTMTVGYISGLGRLLPVNESETGANYSIPDVIQTDTAINPGNSGGVLLDTNGSVIGVTSNIVSASGASAGVGFAIPSVIVQKVVPSLISTGHYEHPYLGIAVISLTPEVAQAMNLPSDQRGALVQSVTQGSPADQAGLKAGQNQMTIDGQSINIGGDIIIKYEELVVNGSDDLITFLSRFGSVGESVNLTVIRDGGEVQLPVVLGARPS